MNKPRLSLLALALALASCSSCKGTGLPGAAPPEGHLASSTAPSATSGNPMDVALRAAWTKAGIEPGPVIDDARFLRRAYIDIVGTIPPPDVVTAFVADVSSGKRQKEIDALLASPKYADRWTDYWDSLLLGQFVQQNIVDRGEFRKWLHTRFEKNVGWNELVSSLVTATGTNRPGEDGEDEADVNGAVNWLLKYDKTPQDLSGNVSRLFLGVQIQCAQCHDHKTEKWTQADFKSFTAVFARTRPDPLGEATMKQKRLEVHDIDHPLFAAMKNPDFRAISLATPKALDGTDLSEAPNRRKALADWMTKPDNPWFARAIVNRLWAHFLGHGFVEPIDDFRPSNPPVAPELLDLLAQRFVQSGYDLKELIRTICTTQAYEMPTLGTSAKDPKAPKDEAALWSRYRLDPMPPEVLLNALIDATHLDPVLDRVAGGKVDELLTQIRRQFGFLFDVDEESPYDTFEGTIPQALMLLNGVLVNGGASEIPGTALADILSMPGDDAKKIEALYLRTLSRKPTDIEVERWTRFLDEPRDVMPSPKGPRGKMPKVRQRDGKKKGPGDPLGRFDGRIPSAARTAKEQAYEDMFWALLNSSEFLFNH